MGNNSSTTSTSLSFYRAFPLLGDEPAHLSQNVSPHLASTHLTSPHLTSPHLISSHLISSHLISSHLISPSHPPILPFPHNKHKWQIQRPPPLSQSYHTPRLRRPRTCRICTSHRSVTARLLQGRQAGSSGFSSALTLAAAGLIGGS